MRTTPELILTLEPNEIFVFGSNESGIHGAGAARLAFEKFGAIWGIGMGHQGKSYAIPTKDFDIITLPLDIIKQYIEDFIAYAKDNPDFTFLVTKIGCGLASYKEHQIGPLFENALTVKNIVLPEEFISPK